MAVWLSALWLGVAVWLLGESLRGADVQSKGLQFVVAVWQWSLWRSEAVELKCFLLSVAVWFACALLGAIVWYLWLAVVE